MIDFDEREGHFARLRVAADVDAGALATSNAEEAPAAIPGNAEVNHSVPEADRPVIVYDEYPIYSAYRLRYAFHINGQRIEQLFFAEPSFADVEDRVHGRITEQELHARMAGVDVDVLRALKWCDSRIATLLARAVAPDLGDV